MSFVVKYLEDQGYVFLKLSGAITKDELEASREDVSQALVDNDYKKLLIDMSEAEPRESLTQDFQFTSELYRHFPAGTRLAIIIPPEETKRMEFVKDVASNRGVRTGLFHDEGSALDWLVGG